MYRPTGDMLNFDSATGAGTQMVQSRKILGNVSS